MSKVNILLDMDGVVTDWVDDVAKLFGHEKDELISRWPVGKFEIESVMFGITGEEMWAKINPEGAEFWTNMKELPWARRLYSECQKRGEVYFLTAPSNEPSCLAGKVAWLQKFTGDKFFKNYLIGKPKYLCARPGNILIDDADKNINEFRKQGGCGILLPHVWNSNHAEKGDKVDYALEQLDAYISLNH